MLQPLEIADVLSGDECRQAIAEAVAHKNDAAALIGGVKELTTRRAQIYWLNEEKNSSWIFDRLLKTIVEANRRHFDFQIEEFSERMQVSHYSAEHSGFFDWHVDVGAGRVAARRKLTVVVQLSDDNAYEGGSLESNSSGLITKASRQIGSALILPSFVLHRVSPVLSGERYSLTLWSHGPAFR
ncbi:MAG: 2OG-Fe(II) oxygenase [Hyphomicrobiaceae bacterium]